MKLPNGNRAHVDIAKLRDYSLDPAHKEGRHKARVFAAALGLTRNDVDWLRDQLLAAARTFDCQPGQKTDHGQAIFARFRPGPPGQIRTLAKRVERAPQGGFP